MNETIKTILERRSVRKYTAAPIPPEDLEQILQAGLYGATSRGRQARHICVLANPEKIARLNQVVRASSALPGYDKYSEWTGKPEYSIVFGQAPVFAILSGDDEASSSPDADCALALGNMMNAAWSLGIGSCWINQLVPLNREPGARAFFTQLGIPETYRICAAACFGYPETPPAAPPPRKPESWCVIQ